MTGRHGSTESAQSATFSGKAPDGARDDLLIDLERRLAAHVDERGRRKSREPFFQFNGSDGRIHGFIRLLLRKQQRSRPWMARGPAMRRGVCESPDAHVNGATTLPSTRCMRPIHVASVLLMEKLCGGRHQCQMRPSSNWTSTRSPAAQLPVSADSTMKQFACDIDERIPEPCSPVVRTVNAPAPSGARMPR